MYQKASSIFKKLMNRNSKKRHNSSIAKYKIHQHLLKRNNIHHNAVGVLKKLYQSGFEAYLVGGAVRDALQGITPKDFDIATNAHPEQIRRVFRNSRIIGRRFKLVHVYFGRKQDIIEVATFRAPDRNKKTNQSGMIMRDNIYGSLKQDAARRDFSINALYYDWQEDCIIDFHGGMNDIQTKKIRLLGEPTLRYKEDPVRMLRAIRFMAKLKFTLDDDTEQPIRQLSHLLKNIPVARLYEEYFKLFHMGSALETFEQLQHFHLLPYLFPMTNQRLHNDSSAASLIKLALADTDNRLKQEMSINPGYLLAVFLWREVQEIFNPKSCKDMPPVLCMSKKGAKILKMQRKSLSVPKRLSALVLDIWVMQIRFQKTRGKNPFWLIEHPKYRAGYDFLCLRYRAGEDELAELVNWWSEFQDADKPRRNEMIKLQ